MTKKNIIDRVNDYNEKFRSMTANKAQDTYASILTDTDKLNAEVKTAALEKLIDKPEKSPIILALVNLYACDAYSVKQDSKTGILSVATRDYEFTYKEVSKAYSKKYGTHLSNQPTFDKEVEGFFGKVLENNALKLSEGGKAAEIVTKDSTTVVDASAANIKEAHSKTKLMKDLVNVWTALLPEDLFVKPRKCELENITQSLRGDKGRKAQTRSADGLMKTMLETIKKCRNGEAYKIRRKF